MINIPVQDCGEPLAEIASVPAIALDPRERDEAGAYGRVRIGVLKRLCSAAGELPGGVGFLIIEGHRSSTEPHRTGDEKYCPLDASGLSGQARRNRNLLARAMAGAGFINYPTEWWHWSYGDRYWALITKADSAIYGPA